MNDAKKSTTVREELAVLEKVVYALANLDKPARSRVFNYLWDRYVSHPSAEDEG